MRVGLAILCCLVSSLASAEDFGRLFTNPEQRRALDSLRLNQSLDVKPGPAVPEVIVPVVVNAPSEVRYSGYVRRPDGSYSVWVNGLSALSRRDSPVQQVQFLNAPAAWRPR